MVLFAQHSVANELDTLLAFARQYELHRHDQRVATLLARPWFADEHDIAYLRERLQSFVAFHREHPWRVMPQGLLNGPFTIAKQLANGAEIRLTDEQLARHGLLFGSSGAGKTTVVRLLIRQLLLRGVKLVVPDYKDDYRRLAATDQRFIILDEHALFNPLQRPAHLSVAEFVALIVDEVARNFYGGQQLKRHLTAALLQAFRDHDQPCLADLPPLIERTINKHSTFTERDGVYGLLQRLQRFEAMYPSIFHCRRGITTDQLFQHSVYLPLRVTSEAGQLLLAILVQLLFQHQRGKQRRGGLEYMLILDEGKNTWSDHQTNIEEEPLLASLMTMVRESAIGMFVTTTTAKVSPLLQSNVFFQIALNMSSGDDDAALARTFDMTIEEAQDFTMRQQRGDCIIKLADVWRYPIRAHFDRDDEPKDVTDADWDAAVERTRALAPNVAAKEEVTQLATLSPSPSPTIAAPALAPNATVLNAAQRHFLTVLCERGVATVIEMYDHCRLKPMQGDRIKKRLLALGLITASRITIGATRGKQATGLMPTPTAYAMVGTKRPRLGRGSGTQHAWLLRTLHERIPNSAIEVNGADIAIAYNADVHARLLEALGRQDLSLNNGDSVAIEVELDPARTAKPNLERNREYTIVIIAVPKTELQTAQRVVKRYQNAIVVDVFALLDTLETT